MTSNTRDKTRYVSCKYCVGSNHKYGSCRNIVSNCKHDKEINKIWYESIGIVSDKEACSRMVNEVYNMLNVYMVESGVSVSILSLDPYKWNIYTGPTLLSSNAKLRTFKGSNIKFTEIIQV